MRDLAVELWRSKAGQRRARTVGAEQIELAIREVAPVLARLEELRVDRLDLRRPTERLDVSVHELAVIADGPGCFEHDVEMIEAAEVSKKQLEIANRRRALRQQPEDIGVERDTRHEEHARETGGDRDPEHEHRVPASEGQKRFH